MNNLQSSKELFVPYTLFPKSEYQSPDYLIA